MPDSILRQASVDLQEALISQGLAEPEQATATLEATLADLPPLLFQSGLCAGYPLKPAPHQYFVAQEFSADREDLLRALEGAFRVFNLRPYRADQDILAGHILCKIAAKLQTTLFGVFELTHRQNRNVYLELGVAIGMGRPFVLVKEANAELPSLIEGLDYYNIQSYAVMQRELGARLQEYVLSITQYQRAATEPDEDPNNTYIIAHGDYDMPLDFTLAVSEGLASTNLHPVLVGSDSIEDAAGLAVPRAPDSRLDAIVKAIRKARFGIYRVDAGSSPDVFLALGLAIGLNKPWFLCKREGSEVPTDVRGLSMWSFKAFIDLQSQILQRLETFTGNA
jgi:hypothetical protein